MGRQLVLNTARCATEKLRKLAHGCDWHHFIDKPDRLQPFRVSDNLVFAVLSTLPLGVLDSLSTALTFFFFRLCVEDYVYT